MTPGPAAKPYRARTTEGRTVPYIQMQVHIPARLESALDREANQFSLSRTRWVIALVEHRLAHTLQFPRSVELTLIRIRTELRRTRRDLAKIALSANDPSIQSDLQAVSLQLESLKSSIDAAFADSGRYWRGS